MARPEKRESYKSPDRPLLERMFYFMKLARMAEERIERVLYRQGKVVGGVYVGRGQEAVGVGTAIQLRESDVMLPNHRDFAAFMIRGFPLAEILANWMARSGGTTRGRENTLHLGNLKHGVIPIISHLGDTCPVACGVAMTLKRRANGNVALVTFGEGTTSRGDVHEAMNLASVMKLPVIFVCNNNGFAYSTPTSKQYAVKNLSVRGAAYNMPGVTVDGMDVMAVHAAAAKAIARARAGNGPSFIECKTYRLTGHSAHDMAAYVPEEIHEEGARKDPLGRLEKILLAKKLMTHGDVRTLEDNIRKAIDEAVMKAEASPMPEGASALEGVYCDSNCWWEKTSFVPGP